MARGRMLKQGFVTSDKLNAVSRDARLLYACLLPFLDREGRSVAEPTTLKVTHLRQTDFTPEEIAALLVELEGVGLLALYADKVYDAILEYADFLEHNKPNAREAASIFPKAGTKKATEVRDPLILKAFTDKVSETSRTNTETESVNDHGQGQTDHAVNVHAGREGKVNYLPTTPPEPAREAGGRSRRPPPPAVQAYLDRTTQADTTTADELAALQAKWAKTEGPISS